MNTQKYAVIGKWTELDGTQEWDVIHNGPLSYDEALIIAKQAGQDWNKNVPKDRQSIPHQEIPITFEKLQSMINEYQSE